jgi:hypothetical protein
MGVCRGDMGLGDGRDRAPGAAKRESCDAGCTDWSRDRQAMATIPFVLDKMRSRYGLSVVGV